MYKLLLIDAKKVHLNGKVLEDEWAYVALPGGGRGRGGPATEMVVRHAAGGPGLVGDGLRLLGVVGGVADHHRHLLEGRAGFSDARALLVASLGERLAGGRELAGGGGGLRCPFLERIGDRAQGAADGADDAPADQGADAGGGDQEGKDKRGDG